MKKILLTIFTALLLASCTNDFDPKLYGTLSTNNFPSTKKEYESYMLTVYYPFTANWGYSFVNWQYGWYVPELGSTELFDMCSDEMVPYNGWGGHWAIISSGDFSSLKSQAVSGCHFEKVRDITRDSKIIYDLQNASSTVLSESVKNEYTAEARFARGVNMYFLLHLYGPVPVIIDGAQVNDVTALGNMARPTRTDYVGWIEADLKYAVDHLPVTASNYGRFTKGAALTYLMRLYMNEKNFVNAESIGRQIVAMNKYSLVSDYASLFNEATENNSETIWSLISQNNGNYDFNFLSIYCMPSSISLNKINGGWGSADGGVFSMSWKFYDTFESGDLRKNCMITSYQDRSNPSKTWDRTNLTGAVINKYPALGGSTNSAQGNDIVACRYADVLMMLAEAINENNGPTSEAIGYVNQIRNRAGLANLSSSSTASKEVLRSAIFMERGHEFFFEGLRKMDMRRMGYWTNSYMTQYNKTIGSYYWPVPDYVTNNYSVITKNYTE